MPDLVSICIDVLSKVQGGAKRITRSSGDDQVTRLRLEMLNTQLAECKAKIASAAETPARDRERAYDQARSFCSSIKP